MESFTIYMDTSSCLVHTSDHTKFKVGDIIKHEDDMYVVDSESSIITLHGYHVDGTSIFIPHNEQGPAWIHHDKIYYTKDSHNFFIHGIKVHMEDITNDPTLKLLVELKWGHLRLDTFRDNVYV